MAIEFFGTKNCYISGHVTKEEIREALNINPLGLVSRIWVFRLVHFNGSLIRPIIGPSYNVAVSLFSCLGICLDSTCIKTSIWIEPKSNSNLEYWQSLLRLIIKLNLKVVILTTKIRNYFQKFAWQWNGFATISIPTLLIPTFYQHQNNRHCTCLLHPWVFDAIVRITLSNHKT